MYNVDLVMLQDFKRESLRTVKGLPKTSGRSWKDGSAVKSPIKDPCQLPTAALGGS